jgi:hypothetical protein
LGWEGTREREEWPVSRKRELWEEKKKRMKGDRKRKPKYLNAHFVLSGWRNIHIVNKMSNSPM